MMPLVDDGVHDVAVALLDQAREEHLVAPHDPEQVHVEQARPLLSRDLLRTAGEHRGHVVHHDVDPTELVETPGASGDEVVALGHVEVLPHRARPPSEVISDATVAARVSSTSVTRHLRRRGGELGGHRPPDAAPAARDHCYRALQDEGCQVGHASDRTVCAGAAAAAVRNPCRLTSPRWAGCATRARLGANSSPIRW